MEIIFEIIFTFFLELFGQILLELLAEFGIRGVSNALGIQKPRSPIMAFAGYIILAAIGGFLSLIWFENHLLRHQRYQLLNLAITPFLAGFIMKIRGDILDRNNKKAIRLDSFWYGYAFALTFALVRFFFAK